METYTSLLVISNVVAILQLVTAFKWQRLARGSFVLLFAWASAMNWFTSQYTPHVYLEYADLTWSNAYRQFINGWFREHIQLCVGIIATCQGLIAIGLVLKDNVFRLAGTGAILFLLAILPLGIGAGFPCTAIMATGVFVLLKTQATHYLFEKRVLN
jgi:hypothetical protein